MRILYIALSLIFTLKGFSQKPIYKHFGVDEGLPSSQVYDICQDKQGYIWFATDKGLSRFNGYEFENFNTNDGLPGNVILRFYPQQNGEIWGYSYHNKALFYFNKNFDGFKAYKHNNLIFKELKAQSIVKSFIVDDFKTVHLGGSEINGEVIIEDNGTIKRKHNNTSNLTNEYKRYIVLNDYKKSKNSYFLTSDKNIKDKEHLTFLQKGGHIQATWFANNKNALFMDGYSVYIVKSDEKVKAIESKYNPLRLKVIDSTSFFVGYHFGGAKIFDDKGVLKNHYLKEKSITNFLIDNEGGYWFTTLNSGVYYIKEPSITYFKSPNNQTYSHISSLAKKNNDLLIGYNNGGFGELLANKNFKFKKSITNYPPALVEYDSLSKKTYIYKNNVISINKINRDSFFSLKLSEPTINGTIYSSGSNYFYNINKKINYSINKRVLDVSVSLKDTLIATHFGVFKKNKDSIVSLSEKHKMLGYRSDDIDTNAKEDCFFIATQGAGVVVYGKEIYNISVKDGLTSNIVNEIYVENDSIIWACTNKGLNKITFNKIGFHVTSLNKNDGLLSNEIEDIEIINDTLFVGSKEGLSYMPKKVFEKKQLDKIYLKLKAVKVNNSIYDVKKTAKLNYNQNKIFFLVEGISFAKNDDLHYKYRLQEIDKKWNTTKNRSISFPNLKEGKYTFQVKACLGIKCYDKNKLEYKFIIMPPFWKSWWFYTLCFLLFCSLLYVFFKIRVLTYNKDIVREFIRLLIKRLKKDEKYLEIRMNGENIKIVTSNILFIKSSGNYLDIICTEKTYTIRCKIGNFIATTPDALEYVRIHRSYIIRIDKVIGISKKTVTIKNHTIPVGETYLDQLDLIHF